jgi:hypothetical protein
MKFVLGILVILLLTSCFKKDDIIPLEEVKDPLMVIDKSMYLNQIFYDLNTNKIIGYNSNDAWDLSFDCRANNWDIRVNSGKLIGAWATNLTDFNTTNFSNIKSKRYFDKSSGDPDSLAISNWVDTSAIPFTYTNQVFLIGKTTDGGYNYLPFKKVVFKSATDSTYQFKYANLDGTGLNEIEIRKDTSYNRIFFSFTRNDTIQIEPPKNDWDMVFCQYFSTLYTDAGLPVPYPLRGTLINSYNVEAALDTANNFETINKASLNDFQFSGNWDIIGYDWKSVEINEGTNSAIYTVRSKNNYIIKDTHGFFYKLKFLSFNNYKFEPGFPTFIVVKLN